MKVSCYLCGESLGEEPSDLKSDVTAGICEQCYAKAMTRREIPPSRASLLRKALADGEPQ